MLRHQISLCCLLPIPRPSTLFVPSQEMPIPSTFQAISSVFTQFFHMNTDWEETIVQ